MSTPLLEQARQTTNGASDALRSERPGRRPCLVPALDHRMALGSGGRRGFAVYTTQRAGRRSTAGGPSTAAWRRSLRCHSSALAERGIGDRFPRSSYPVAHRAHPGRHALYRRCRSFFHRPNAAPRWLHITATSDMGSERMRTPVRGPGCFTAAQPLTLFRVQHDHLVAVAAIAQGDRGDRARGAAEAATVVEARPKFARVARGPLI